MAHGIVTWFDAKTGEGRIARGARRYVCRAEEMESSAQASGVHVHFDVSGDGTAAGNVRARGATLGRRRPHHPYDEGGPYSVELRRGATASPADDELRRVIHPTAMNLARWWAASLATGSLDDALALYSPDATVQINGEPVTGRTQLGGGLEGVGVFATGCLPDEVSGDGDDVVVFWFATDAFPATRARMRLVHNEIIEQSLEQGAAAEGEEVGARQAAFPVQVVAHGPSSRAMADTAVEKVLAAAEIADAPVLFARIKLTQLPDPAASRPALAEASLDIDGDYVRAHASADEMADAIDRLERRLRDQLSHRREHGAWIRPTAIEPEPGEWRHGNLDGHGSKFFDRPVEDRQIVRHKAWSGEHESVDEAVFDLEILDHDFHLFRDVTSGEDCMVTRLGDGTHRLSQRTPHPESIIGAAAAVTLDDRPAPDVTLTGAIDLLNMSGEPVTFFSNRTTGRGNVIYRRFDGHYGLITPDE